MIDPQFIFTYIFFHHKQKNYKKNYVILNYTSSEKDLFYLYKYDKILS